MIQLPILITYERANRGLYEAVVKQCCHTRKGVAFEMIITSTPPEDRRFIGHRFGSPSRPIAIIFKSTENGWDVWQFAEKFESGSLRQIVKRIIPASPNAFCSEIDASYFPDSLPQDVVKTILQYDEYHSLETLKARCCNN